MAAVVGSARHPSAERRFFTGIALVMLVTVVVGFSRSVFLRPLFPDWHSPSEPIFYLHGAMFVGWIVLLVVQASLVAGGRSDLHRRVGQYGAALAVAMVVLATIGALIAARRSTGFVDVPVPPLQFLATPMFDMALFGSFVWLAIERRRDPQAHKRWMLLATTNLLTAAIARWPVIFDLPPVAAFALTDLFIVAQGVWDFRSRGRLHPATLWGGAAIVVSQPLRVLVSGTAGWLAFARWATGLLG